jgi:hypothetical protein
MVDVHSTVFQSLFALSGAVSVSVCTKWRQVLDLPQNWVSHELWPHPMHHTQKLERPFLLHPWCLALYVHP